MLRKQKELGNHWSEIAKFLPGRPEIMIKNRFNTLAKQNREQLRKQRQHNFNEAMNSIEAIPDHKNSYNWVDNKIKQLEYIAKERQQESSDNNAFSENILSSNFQTVSMFLGMSKGQVNQEQNDATSLLNVLNSNNDKLPIFDKSSPIAKPSPSKLQLGKFYRR